ncbi:putative nucleotidyltransferase, ribonuclease H [Tanacetum coccineum]
MEEMLSKFTDKGKREHEEMETFIRMYRTTKELLLIEQNNLLSELKIKVHGLSRVMNDVLILENEVKGVTTRCGRMTTEIAYNGEINNINGRTTRCHLPKRAPKNKRMDLSTLSRVQMPKYAKFMKNLLTKKSRLEEACTVTMKERCSAVLLNKLPSKEKDPGSFTIPCHVRDLHINNALADLGASIRLMPYTMYEKLGLGEPKPTRMSLELADRVLIILGRPFLAIARAMIDVFNKKIMPRVGDDEISEIHFLLKDLEKGVNQLDLDNCSLKCDKIVSDSVIRRIDSIDTVYSGEQRNDSPYNIRSEHLYSASASEIDEKRPELKSLPSHLEYAYLNGDESFLVIISSKLSEKEKKLLLQVLENHKGAMAWKMSDIKGISPSFCTHKGLMEDDFKPVIQPQWRLNPKVQDVVKNEILKLLDSGLIYPISDSSMVQLDSCCSKKGGNDHGFLQILIASEDQEKTTFNCPYGTFAYRRMPFGLCNTPATFQRCMIAIFHDMVEDFMKVFMDDFSVFGNSFDNYFVNLEKMLARCEEIDLVLNWEKCHFMVREEIVLGHKVFGLGIEVDKAKIDVIAKLPYPTNVKGVRSFLGHAGFYRRFIKGYSMISKPMTQLLLKDVRFDFSNDCKKTFNILKEKLTTAPIIISPDWNIPFELMCNASDFAVRVVLGQIIDGKFKPIYYASKTLNNSQEHYTAIEKELLVVIFAFDKFRPYLVLSKTIVYTDHCALKYLFNKQDAKPRLIRWVLLLQGFNIEIKDNKGA